MQKNFKRPKTKNADTHEYVNGITNEMKRRKKNSKNRTKWHYTNKTIGYR